ncbi:Probable A/G-specific adenine glycosylase YfhQ [Chlamydiales bacterium SCGC AG-110-M15]|nr:Probable A/G-specific adenine glycosylase YfhQ [Chlamydiales bacterium SCGC AG-110-M15]
MKQKTFSFDHNALMHWFNTHKRDLPWRHSPEPYQVWVSEIMLQQTQVDVVIPYYTRWMKRFPTLKDLALAKLDEVIKLWEGLGYYSRARNLHFGAQQVMQEFDGVLPDNADDLKRIKGLGPYTVGAILSFAFKQKAAAVDGNVMRVLARYFLIQEDISKPQVIKKIRSLTEEILPDKHPWVMTEGLIELGALICKRKAECGACPLKMTCLAHTKNQTSLLPYKAKKVIYTPLYRAVAIIMSDNMILLKRGEKGKIMSDLHEFPYIETDEKGLSINDFKKSLDNSMSLGLTYQKSYSIVPQSFTKYRVRLSPVLFSTFTQAAPDGFEWFSLEAIHSLAFSSGHKRILNYYLQDKHETHSSH